MEPSSSNERDQRINMTSMFDGDQTAPAKKERSRSNEVVKKLSFQLGCQSHDEDLHASKNASPILQEDGATEKLKPDDKAIIIDLNMNVMDNHIERIDVNDPGALISPVPRHHYNRNTISMHSTLKEKEEMDIENDMIYDSLRSRRRYQLWRGNNVFLCYGRLMLGVHIGHLTLSVALITGTWITFILFIAPFTQSYQAHTTFMAFFFFLLNLTLLIATATTEPGIIPSKRLPGLSPIPIRKSASPQSQICSSCNITKPKRAKHCRHCNNCVEVFDHHCPWTGTCIGIRNYGHFICFVASVVVGSFYLLSSSIFILIGWITGLHSNAPYLRAIAVIIGLSWSLLLILLVGMLFMFHIFLIIRGQTTSEFLRGVPLPDLSGVVLTSNCCLRRQTKLLPMWQYFSYDDFSEEFL